MKKNLEELIADIKEFTDAGENSVVVIADSITEEEIKEIQKKIGIEYIKDVTEYCMEGPSREHREEHAFLIAAYKSSKYEFIYKNVFLKDGSVTVKRERLPLFLIICTADWERLSWNRNLRLNCSLLTRWFPSFHYNSVLYPSSAE